MKEARKLEIIRDMLIFIPAFLLIISFLSLYFLGVFALIPIFISAFIMILAEAVEKSIERRIKRLSKLSKLQPIRTH